MTTEALAGATSIVSAILTSSIEAQYKVGVNDKSSTERSRNAALYVNWISFGSFVALALGGALHAEITFVPQSTETHSRPLPPDLSWRLIPSLGPQQASLSLQAQF